MKTIWKYQIPVTDEPVLVVPTGAKFLPFVTTCALPRTLNVWAEVDSTAPPEERALRIIGTGNPLEGVRRYLGSVLDSPFVWHVYEGATEGQS